MVCENSKIAMFGGTFNPLHNGHLNLCFNMLKELKLDKIILIPTNIPPHKPVNDYIDPKYRIEMCSIASKYDNHFEVSNIEIERKGKSYTVDTLKFLTAKYKVNNIYLLMGSDMFLTIDEWKDPTEIFKLATLCTAPRNNNEFEILKKKKNILESCGAKVILLNSKVVKVSSTEIRARVRQGKDISDLVPKEIEKYIFENKIYMESKND